MCRSEHRRKYLLRQDCGTGQNSQAKISPGTDNAGYRQIHDVFGNSNIDSGRYLCRGYWNGSHFNIDLRNHLPHGSSTCCSTGGFSYCPVGGGWVVVKKGVLVTRLDSIEDAASHRHTVPGQDGDHYSEPASLLAK